MKREYQSGKEAREKFERTMTALFRAPKTAKKPTKRVNAKKKGRGE
jgi:hypothetical protein